jgi:hypothetical protein
MKTPLCLGAFVAASLLSLHAGAETFADCEKLENPLAYNQCLASHGPSAAGALAARESVDAATSPPRARYRFGRVRAGRQRAVFDVGAGPRPHGRRRLQ